MSANGRKNRWSAAATVLLRLDRIQHDLPGRDRRWFTEWQLGELYRIPWLQSDLVRIALILALLWGAPVGVMLAAALGMAALWLLEAAAYTYMVRLAARRWQRRMAFAQTTLLARAAGWATVLAMTIANAPEGKRGLAVLFAATATFFEALCIIPVPVVGLIASWIMIVGACLPLALHSDAPLLLIALLGITQALASHYILFDLHYRAVTRTLRSRNLVAAHDTIRLLLSQYDEHGNDFLVEVDPQGHLIDASSKLCEALGRTRTELRGIDFAQLFEPSRELNAIIADGRALRSFRNRTISMTIAGRRRWWSISGCPIYDTDGRYQGFRGFAQDVTERRVAEEQVRLMASSDPLTGLANRSVFTERLSASLQRKHNACAVLYIDLDGFKPVNDTFGHGAGDALLRETARRIAETVGPAAVCARLGGDEFAVLLSGTGAARRAAETADRLVQAIGLPFESEGQQLSCGASVGIALAPQHAREAEGLMRAADVALYEAKARGRRCAVMFHPDMLVEVQERRQMERDLHRALGRGEFSIEYQPLLEIEGSKVIGYEALLRWNHPERGAVPPSQFIPIAEEIGAIVPIGEWVLREALSEAADWKEDLTIAINVSPAQMRGQELLGQVMGALSATGIAPERLELEITENMLMHECDMHLRTLHRLRNFGVRIALDDFGTGYSSLNYLRSFPFDKIKIDRSFVRDLSYSDKSKAIVETVLALAGHFNMVTLAEGVEETGQLETLAAMGCSQVQGHLFSKAVSPAQIPEAHRRSPLQDRGPGWCPFDEGQLAAIQQAAAAHCAVSCRKCG